MRDKRSVLRRQCSDTNRNIKSWCVADMESKVPSVGPFSLTKDTRTTG